VSVWDLLFPLLQRPVNLDLGTVVDLPSNLYSFQTKGVEFLVEKQSALLGDDMGTGKTVQTAVALRMLFQTAKIRTALVVCPLSVIPNWARELAKWAGNLAVTVVRGGKERRKICWRQPAHIWLTTYDTLRNDLVNVLTFRKGGFDLVALDEAQRIKNWSSGITRSVRQLRATYRWGLTGTPLENNTDELWTILNVLKPNISEGPLDWSEGIQSVLKPMFLRRRKQDVLTDLPPLVQNPVWLRLEDEQRRSYDQLEKQGVLELHAKGETITAQIVIVLLNKLKQVCNRCPKSGESSKLVWLRDSLENVVAEGDKALVFSQYTDERFAGADWLEKELADFGALNYSKATSDNSRKALLAAFKEKSEHKVFVGHPKTAGLGLNELVVANYVVHFDHWWNPAVMNQATARAHRPGQTKTVFAYDLWVEGTYEEIIFKLLERKQGLYNEVIDSISAQCEQPGNLAFAVADTLFAKYGLKPLQRKPVAESTKL
jgi:SNF2 family DNA or RNA helicase